MKKKVLVLGSVACVAGIVTASGCTSETGSGTPAPDASQDVRAERTPIEAGEEDAATCYQDVKLSGEALDWKPAAPSPGTCTSAELTQFEANYKDNAITTWKDIGQGISEACASCLITPLSAAKWGFVVYVDEDPATGFQNWGACFSMFEGDACGKSVHNSQTCSLAACDACEDQNSFDSCTETAGAGACAEYVGDVEKNCPKISNNAQKCGTRVAAIKTLCGGTIPDGGGDSGDAGDAADQ